jgi:hypothetical protein
MFRLGHKHLDVLHAHVRCYFSFVYLCMHNLLLQNSLEYMFACIFI